MEERNYKLYVHISPSNKRYYGITCQKYAKYRWDSGHGYRNNKHFTNAINKYGWENFQHLVLFDNLTKEEACLLEQCYIALYDTTNPKYGYNNSLGGEHGLASEHTKKKISENNAKYWKGKQLTEETRKKMSENHADFKGKNNPMYGKQFTEEHKKKLSEAKKGKYTGKNSPNYGKQFTEEHRNKISEAKKGQKLTEETKKKISEANKGENNYMYGKHHNEETKKKISESNKGKYRGKNSSRYGKGKPILMFSKNNEFIQRFDCVADANEFLGKDRDNNNINMCARGKTKTAYGYIWIYEEDYIKEQEEQAI